jgi:hypothetical protein
MKTEDLLLELQNLQKIDTKQALQENIVNKTNWFKNCLQKEEDNIADAIINISTRYNIPELTIAKLFDETMIYRVIKQMERNKKVAAK